jgi:hypothetical protein
MTKLHDEDAPGKFFDAEAVEAIANLSDDLQAVLEAHGAGPNSAVALTALARLMALVVNARPAHVSRLARWRGLLKVMSAAEWMHESGYVPNWLEGSEVEALRRFSSGETGEGGLDELLVALLHEGCGKPMDRGVACQS